ncbi:ABC transporter permease, partial [bacterium]
MIELKNVTKIYRLGEVDVTAVKGVDLRVEKGEFLAIMGASGSGKSTMMNMIGCLDKPTSGEYLWHDQKIDSFNEWELAEIRNQKIGFIFQQFNLLSRISALDNIELPLIYSGTNINRQKEAYNSLELVNLNKRAHHFPNQLSGGERQRVAIARALINKPELLLADEPTGNLDSKTGKEIMQLITELNEKGVTIILVTHDPHIASYAHRQVEMKDGMIIKETTNSRSFEPEKASISFELKRRKFSFKEIKEFFSIAITSIFSHKLRSFLTMLGIIIGVGAVITMIALGQGARAQVTARISNLGANLLMVRPGPPRTGRQRVRGSSSYTSLKLKDVESLQRNTQFIKNVAPSYSGSVQAVYKNKNKRTSVRGVTSVFPEVKNYKVETGRFFNTNEEKQAQRIAVIGKTVASELFEDENPLGLYIKLNRIIFQVIGILKEKGASGWRDEDDIILVPLICAQKRLFGVDYVSNIDVEAVSSEKMKEAEQEIDKILRREHRIKSDNELDFNIRSQAEILSTMEDTTKSFTLLLAGIAFVSLIVGGIGIMNIMLVSVMERTREIGIRKALGAQKRDILGQFLIEAMVISITGGILGVMLGASASWLASKVTSWPTLISLQSIILSTSFALIIGIFFGLWPAKKAA